MTVGTTQTTSRATGDGVTATFPFTFTLLQASDMTVYVNTVFQTQGSQYTITPAGNQYPCVGGNIVFTGGNIPPNLSAILMARQLTLIQPTALPVEGNLPSATLENVFDRATMQIQQLETQIGLCLQLPITSAGSVLVLPSPVANDVLGWDPTATFLTNFSPAQVVAGAILGTSGVFGPATTIVGQIAVFNNTTGSLLKAVAADSSLIFGGGSNSRPLPTSGTITGEYNHNGNWVQTGTITSIEARINITGTMTINGTWNIATEMSGGRGGNATALSLSMAGTAGAGLAPGSNNLGSSSGSFLVGGGGGGHGGAGGDGGAGESNFAITNGGGTYSLRSLLAGSGGGGGGSNGSSVGSAGGKGGGSLLIQTTGAITFTNAAVMNGNGQVGAVGVSVAGAGGGGSGAGIMIRSLVSITLTSGGSMTANGGAGGASAGTIYPAGGGGGGGIIDLSAPSIVTGFTPVANGGAAGSGGQVIATAGSTGIVNINTFVQYVRAPN